MADEKKVAPPAKPDPPSVDRFEQAAMNTHDKEHNKAWKAGGHGVLNQSDNTEIVEKIEP